MSNRLRTLLICLLLIGTVVPAAAAGAAAADPAADDAQIAIEQPHYVSEGVQTSRTNNTTTYEVEGSHFEILPQNFDADQVVTFGVREESASMTFDRSTGEFVLNVQETGTYRLYWTATKQVAAGNNSTTTQRVRYETRVQVDNAEYQHLSSSRYDELQADAENWSVVVSTFSQIGPDDVGIEQKLKQARNAYEFLVDPLSALSGDASAAIILLTWTNGGRLVLGALLIIPIAIVAPVIISYRRLKKQVPEMADIDEERMRLWKEKRENALVEVVPHKLFDGRMADKMQQHFGDDLREVLVAVFGTVGDEQLKRLFLQAMGQQGYTATQGPDGVEIHEPGDAAVADGGEQPDNPLVNPSADTVKHVDWDDIDRQALGDDVAMDALDSPIEPTDVDDDMLAQFDISIPEDFNSREELADALGQVMQYGLSHNYTDREGCIRPEQSVLNTLHKLATITHERYDVPVMRYYRDMFFYLSDNLSGDEALKAAAGESGFGDSPEVDSFD